MSTTIEKFRKLVAEIKKGHVEPLYFLYGSEQVLAQYVVNVLRACLIPPGMQELNFVRLDGQKVTEADLVQTIETPPMFAAKRLVVLQQPAFVRSKLGESFPLWERLLTNWPPYTCAVILAREVDKRLRTYKELVKKAASYEFSSLTVSEASSWVEERLRRHRIKYPAGTGRFVVMRCGTDLELLSLEVEKMVSYADGNPLSQSDLALLVRDDRETSIFDFVDAIGLQDLNQAWAFLVSLLTEGKEPVYIISMIARQLRLLFVARLSLDAGLSQQQAARRLGIHSFPAGKCVQQARNWTVNQLRAAMDACLQADESIKTGKLKPESALNQLLLDLKRGLSGNR